MARKLNIQTSDLVPTKVLLGIAERVRTVAAQIAKTKHAPLKSSRKGGDKYNRLNIGIGKPVITKSQTSVTLSLTDVAMAFEHGSKPHPIDAKNSPFMWFVATGGAKEELVGKLIRVRHVDHKGFKAKPFLKPAKRQTRQKNLEDIRKTNLANTRLIIASMKRVV